MAVPFTSTADDAAASVPRWVAAGGQSLTDLVDRFRQTRDLTQLDRDPEAVMALSRALAAHSPAGLMLVAGRGKWRIAPHHLVMNDYIARAIAKPEGRLIMSVTVRAGKSMLGARYTPPWFLGMNPDLRAILGAHDGPFAAEHGGFARDVLTEYGMPLYGVTVSRASSARNRWELDGHNGGLVAVGVGGSPIGKGADLMVIDDPLPNFEAAMSDLQRQRVNETWFQGTMTSRLEPGATVIVICSRWHEEDLSGYLKANWPADWEEVHIPALCDDPETDLLNRQLGESFWEDRWSVETLQKRKDAVGPTVWLAQYQQRPTRPEGGIFPIGQLHARGTVDHYDELPVGDYPTLDENGRPVRRLVGVDWDQVVQLCRGWDLAATEGDGDYTVGLLLGRYADGRWVVIDMVRGQWGEAEVRRRIRETADADAARFGAGMVRQVLPQDPAQAGKAQASQLVAMLSGHNVTTERPSGDKVVRASGWAAQVQGGNCDYVADAGWDTAAFLKELQGFPKGQHDDIVDAGSTAFNEMVGSPMVDDPLAGQAAFRGLTRRTTPY